MKVYITVHPHTVIDNGGIYVTEPQNWLFEGDKIEVSDEYHTMDELYEHRMALTAALFNTYYSRFTKEEQGQNFYTHIIGKSLLHNDETMFEGGYFIVFLRTIHGNISYHYKFKHWDKFKIPEFRKAPPYDGHTSKDVIERLLKL